MIQIAGNLDIPGWSGIVQALQNDLSLAASPSGDVIVLLPANLRPSADNAQSLGEPTLRWENLFVASVNGLTQDRLLPVDAREVSGQIIPDSNVTWGLGETVTPRGFGHFVGRNYYVDTIIPYNADTGEAGGDQTAIMSGFLVAVQDNAGGLGTENNSFKWGFIQNLILGGSSGILGASDQAAGIGVSGNLNPIEGEVYGLGDISTGRSFNHIVGRNHYVELLVPYENKVIGPDSEMKLSGTMTPHLSNRGALGTPAKRFQLVAARQMNIASLPHLGIGGGDIDLGGGGSADETEIGVSGSFLPFLDDTFVLGSESSGLKWKNAVIGDTVTDRLLARQDAVDGEITVSGGLIPIVDGEHSLGSVSRRWCDVRACSGIFDSLHLTDGHPIVTSGVQVIYVAKHGNDGFDGISVIRPFKTFAKAAEVASGLMPTSSNRICIRGLDGGIYDDLVYLLPYVDLIAECADFRGHITAFENSTIELGNIFSSRDLSAFYLSQGSAISKYDNGGSGSVIVRANSLEVVGPSIPTFGLPVVGGVQNASISGTMLIDIDRVTAVSGLAIIAAGGRTSLDIGDMVAGDNTTSINIGSLFTEATCNGSVRSIRQGGTLPAIAVSADDCSGNFFVHSILRDSPSSVAWSVTGDNCSFKLMVHTLEGDESDTGIGNDICVVKTCDIATSVNNFSRPVDAREVSGAIFPDTDIVYDLGKVASRFAAIHAASGEFGEVDILAGGDLNILNGNLTCPNGNVGGLTHTATIAGFVTQYATGNTIFVGHRPNMHTALVVDAGSGIALRNENIWYDHVKVSTEAVDAGSLTMSMDNLATRPYGVVLPDTNSCVLADHFGIISSHAGGSKDDWTIYVRRTQANGDVEAGSGIVASGTFGWDSVGDTIRKTQGRWMTSGNIPAEFEPGACYDVVVHNDGSGTVVSAATLRLSLGFRVNAPNLGRGL